MKVLKLDARFEDARRVAQCLVGSHAVDLFLATRMEWGEEIYFSGVLNDSAFGVHNEENYVSMNPKTKSLLMPIDTIKLCPFLATKHRVPIMAIRPDGKITRGRITNIDDCETCQINHDYNTTHFLHEISLDLSPIERGELEGCEIVEV